MVTLTMNEALEKLAEEVRHAPDYDLIEYYSELYMPEDMPSERSGDLLAARILQGVEPEELVSLWHATFPHDRKVWYDHEDEKLRYNAGKPLFAK